MNFTFKNPLLDEIASRANYRLVANTRETIRVIIEEWEKVRDQYVQPQLTTTAKLDPVTYKFKSAGAVEPAKKVNPFLEPLKPVVTAKPAPVAVEPAEQVFKDKNKPPFVIEPYRAGYLAGGRKLLMAHNVKNTYKLVYKLEFTIPQDTVNAKGERIFEGTRTILIYNDSVTGHYDGFYYNALGYLWETTRDSFNIIGIIARFADRVNNYSLTSGITHNKYMWRRYYEMERTKDNGLELVKWSADLFGRKLTFTKHLGTKHGKPRTQILLSGFHSAAKDELYNGLATLNPVDTFSFLTGVLTAYENSYYWNYITKEWVKEISYYKEDLKKAFEKGQGEFEYV